MIAPQRAEPTASQDAKNWRSARVILEGLILAAVLWSAKQMTDTQAQIAVLQVNVLELRTQLADLPNLGTRVTRNETRIDNLEQRVTDSEHGRRQ